MKIILGISGSIAAYKAATLTRLWVKNGHEVQILMTDAAADFITPLTLSTLSKREVLSSVRSESGWNNHVELGLWADAFVIAPATANTLAKLANGLCDNILGAVYLSARCPVFVAPAMDLDMWAHPATRENLAKLERHGTTVIPVGHGELASGLVGAGRMAEPEEIVQFLENHFSKNKPLAGKTALVTAGPTFEPLDPVRFIGNHSSGKMGIAIAEKLAAAGARVRLVLGPTVEKADRPDLEIVRVMTAEQMFQACSEFWEQTDVAVLAAAVADYRPKIFSEKKIKKADDDLKIELAKTVDIAAWLGKNKQKHQILVGFALETNDETANALKKLEKKNLDFIVLNSLQVAGAGFGHDTNQVSFLRRDESRTDFALKLKDEVAADIVSEICQKFN